MELARQELVVSRRLLVDSGMRLPRFVRNDKRRKPPKQAWGLNGSGLPLHHCRGSVTQAINCGAKYKGEPLPRAAGLTVVAATTAKHKRQTAGVEGQPLASVFVALRRDK
ncbi:MAG: hypothetical protein WC476_06330 [Phycisphaerae bacterium]